MEQLHQWDTDGLIMARKHIHRAQAELANVVQTAHFGVGPAVDFILMSIAVCWGRCLPGLFRSNPPSTLQC